MEGLARHVASIINTNLPLGLWECRWRKSAHHGLSLLSSHRPRQPRPQELRSDAAPARTGCLDLNLSYLTQHPLGTDQPCLPALPAQKQMNRLLSRANPLLRSLNRAPLLYRTTARMDYSSVPTPERCYADFCLVPVCLTHISPPHCCSKLSSSLYDINNATPREAD